MGLYRNKTAVMGAGPGWQGGSSIQEETWLGIFHSFPSCVGEVIFLLTLLPDNTITVVLI